MKSRFIPDPATRLLVLVLLSHSQPLAAENAPVHSPKPAGSLPPGDWNLVFADEFEGTPDAWKINWVSDAQAHKHILSSRWPENVSVQDGHLLLTAKKESRGGQDWTAGSIWTKKKFQYGYYEARYRYAQAPGLNNSFWLMNSDRGVEKSLVESGEFTVFEIDVNEGHYPNKISTNIHRHKPGRSSDSRSIILGARAQVSFPLEIPVKTQRLRLLMRDMSRVSVAEIRAYPPTRQGYPAMVDEKEDPLSVPEDRRNLLVGAKAEANSVLREGFEASNVLDGKITNESRWVGTDRMGGNHELVLDLPEMREIGCIQVFSGWRNKGEWVQGLVDFTIQYWNGSAWVDVARSGGSEGGFQDLSADFHTYGLLWTPTELVFYFDGREIRRESNAFCHHPAPVFLSLAVIHWAGPVTDRIDGTSQVIDYVRIWQKPGGP
jgi:beta-glucanase (GH16 family)